MMQTKLKILDFSRECVLFTGTLTGYTRGEAKKDIVDALVVEKVASLTEVEKKRFNDMYAILERKDYLKSIK